MCIRRSLCQLFCPAALGFCSLILTDELLQIGLKSDA